MCRVVRVSCGVTDNPDGVHVGSGGGGLCGCVLLRVCVLKWCDRVRARVLTLPRKLG